jgi:hypothetical protein
MAEDGALRRARQFAQKVPKYEQAVLLDEQGAPVRAPAGSQDPYVMIRPTDEIPAGQSVGCPCCLAPLQQIKKTPTLGASIERSAHFRSKYGIDSHLDRDCPIDHSGEDVEGQVKSILKFVTTPVGENQRKILYLNMRGTPDNPIVLDEHSTDPANFHHAVREGLRTKFLTAVRPQDVATFSVKNGREIVNLLKHPLGPDLAYETDVINHGRRFPLNELLAGYDWKGVYEQAQDDEEMGFAYPTLVEMDIEPNQGGRTDIVVSNGSGMGQDFYQIVLRASAEGEDQAKLEALFQKGGRVLVFGTARALQGKALAKFHDDIRGNSAFLNINDLKMIEYKLERASDVKVLKGSQRVFSFDHTLGVRESRIAEDFDERYERRY